MRPGLGGEDAVTSSAVGVRAVVVAKQEARGAERRRPSRKKAACPPPTRASPPRSTRSLLRSRGVDAGGASRPASPVKLCSWQARAAASASDAGGELGPQQCRPRLRGGEERGARGRPYRSGRTLPAWCLWRCRARTRRLAQWPTCTSSVIKRGLRRVAGLSSLPWFCSPRLAAAGPPRLLVPCTAAYDARGRAVELGRPRSGPLEEVLVERSRCRRRGHRREPPTPPPDGVERVAEQVERRARATTAASARTAAPPPRSAARGGGEARRARDEGGDDGAGGEHRLLHTSELRRRRRRRR